MKLQLATLLLFSAAATSPAGEMSPMPERVPCAVADR